MKILGLIYCLFTLMISNDQETDYSSIESLHNPIQKIKKLSTASDTCEVYEMEYYCKQIIEVIDKLPGETKNKNKAFIESELAKSYVSLSFYYYTTSSFSDAEDYSRKAIEILNQKSGNKLMLANAYNNLAATYLSLNKIDDAIHIYKKNEVLDDDNNNLEHLAIVHSNIAIAYKTKNDFDNAIKYAKKSLSLREKLNIPLEVIKSYSLIGSVYLESGDFINAMLNFDKGLELAETSSQHSYDYHLYYWKGIFYRTKEDRKKAIQMFETALKSPDCSNDIIKLEEIHGELHWLYEDLGDYKSALKHHKIRAKLQSEISVEKAIEESKIKQAKFEYEQRELKLKSSQEKAEIQYQDEKKKREITTIYGLVIGAIILLFLLFVWNRARVLTRQKAIITTQRDELNIQKAELSDKNTLLDKQNRTIMDNMEYAKNIQTSLLPDEAQMNRILKHSCFVNFIPKDIVSGDFYWCFEKNDRQLFVMADCTGHGVTGAFISIIAIKSLEKSVAKYELNEISSIIDQMNSDFLHSFGEESYLFGIEFVMCCFDVQGNLILSGSSNSFYTSINSQLKRYKFNNLQIGTEGYNSDKIELIALEVKDEPLNLYIFTDGITDQKGGDENKKFTSRTLESTLSSIQQFSMNEQKEKLQGIFNNWVKNNDQMDDVSMFGITINQNRINE